MEQRWKGWFGFGFFITPIVLKVLYICSSLLVLGIGAYWAYTIWQDFDTLIKVGIVIGWVVSPFVVRIVFELLLLPFKIHNNLEFIADILEERPHYQDASSEVNNTPYHVVPSRVLHDETEDYERQPFVEPESFASDSDDELIQRTQEPFIEPEDNLTTDNAQSRRLDDIFNAPPMRRQ